MRKLFLLLALLLCAPWSFGQTPIKLGRHQIELEGNVPRAVTRAPLPRVDLGTATNGRVNVLVQFMHAPTQSDRALLRARGLDLQGYVGAHAYFAQCNADLQPSDLAGTALRAIAPVQGAWKIGELLQEGRVPEWAQRGDRVEVELRLFSNISMVEALRRCAERGYTVVGSYAPLRTLRLQLPPASVKALAEENWVRRILPVSPAREAFNYTGSILTRAADVARSVQLGGRGLTGKGVRVGVWDGNVEEHVDYGNRVTRVEQQMSVIESGGHGMHVSGTIGGAGILDPRGRGMAPQVELFNHSFGTGINGLDEAEEMDIARREYGISISSNSYGIPVWRNCDGYDLFSYNYLPFYENLDEVAYNNPGLTIVFACGNDQGSCNLTFGTSFDRTKNTILVGAVDKWGDMTDYSSWGPMDDGRLLPTLCAKGDDVYSTLSGQSYGEMGGTSMACPMTAGIAALLTERYHQLYGRNDPNSALVKGLLANTTYDMGNTFVDYKFGYGIVDAKAAVETLEAGQFLSDTVEADQSKGVKTYDLDVPAGTKELRVMLTWIDPTPGRALNYGESALVNNLDLVVVDGKDSILPYVLNPKFPDREAQRGVDNLNNIEQVVISNPDGKARKVQIVVKGGPDRIVSDNGKQHFIVTWYFNQRVPELVSPVGGEMYAPGEMIVCQTRYVDVNATRLLNIELSYDGGKSYTQIGRTKYPQFSFSIPLDARVTKDAKIRLRTADNHILVSPFTFQIAGRPENVHVDASNCGAASWKLTWDPVAGAKEYNVLVADIEAGEFMKLGEPVKTTELTDLSAALALLKKADKRLVVAVEAVFEGGITSLRSKGVLVDAPRALDLTKEGAIPFTENFIHDPSMYTRIELGEHMKMQYTELINISGMPEGARGVQFIASKDAKEGAVPFESGTNEIKLKTCSIKLPTVDASKSHKLVLWADHLLRPGTGASIETVKLQARVNGKVVSTFAGDKILLGTNELLFTGWDLSAYAGKEVSIEFICYSSLRDGAGIIVDWGIEVSRPEDEDVYVAFMGKIPDGNFFTPLNYEFVVTNMTSDRIVNLPVRALLNGSLFKTITVDTLAPFSEKVVKLPLQFTTESPYGEHMKFELTIDYAKDADPTNNTSSRSFNHYGQVYAHPKTGVLYFFGHKIPIDPRVEAVMPSDGKLLYGDNEGSLGDYVTDQSSTLRFKPSDDAYSVQVAFDSLELLPGDMLLVYTQYCQDLYDVKDLEPTYILDSESDVSKLPAITSESPDGALIFKFFSLDGQEESASGWLARLTEIRRVNSLALVDVKSAVDQKLNKGTLEATVHNLSTVDQRNVLLRYEYSDRVSHVDTISLIKAGEKITVKLRDAVDILSPGRVDYTVEILARDLETSDNMIAGSMANDRYWTGGRFTQKPPSSLSSVAMNGKSYFFVPRVSEHLTYPLPSGIESKALPMFMQSDNRLKVRLGSSPSEKFAKDRKVFMWIETDTTATEFPKDAPFHQVVPMEVGKPVYSFDINLRGQSVKPGIYRVRFVLATDEDLAAFQKGEDVFFGIAADAYVKLIDEVMPSKPDLRIVSVTGLHSGPGISTQTPEITIVNEGNVDIPGVRVKVLVNDEEHSVQELDGVKRDDTIQCKLKELEFGQIGSYNVKFELPKDEVAAGNVFETEILRVAENKKDALYALTFTGDKKEYVALENPKSEDPDEMYDKLSYDGWFYVSKMQFGHMVKSDKEELLIASTNDHMNLGIPKNALVVGHGQTILATKENTLQPGMWHHVAVTFSYEDAYFGLMLSEWAVFIDGKKQELEVEKLGWATPVNSNLKLAPEFIGQVRQFRILKTWLDEAKVQEIMNKSLLDDTTAADIFLREYQLNEGEGQYVTSGEYGLGQVESERITVSNPEKSIWQPLKKLISGVEYSGGAPVVEKPEGTFTLTLEASEFNKADLSKLAFTKVWSDVEVKLADGSALPPNHDFATPLELKASTQKYFFLPCEQAITVKAELPSAKPECDLLAVTISKDKNPGLAADVALQQPSQDEEVILTDESASKKLDRRFVVLTLTDVSEGALVYYGDNTAIFYVKGDDIEVDFTEPVILRVVSSDEKIVKFYTFTAGASLKSQTITWKLDPLSYKLENKKVKMTGTSDSKLPLVYRAYDGNVVTFTQDGEMQLVGVGKTKVEATQPGNEEYLAAVPVAYEVEVTPADIKGWIEDSVQAGKPIGRLVATYEGLLFGEHPATIKRPEVNILVQDNPPVVWDAKTMPPLKMGVYKVVPVENPYPLYTDKGYNITFVDGTLKVLAPESTHSTLTVKTIDAEGTPVEGVEVKINTMSGLTDTKGEIDWLLKNDETYTIYLFSPDYVDETLEFNFTEGLDDTVVVTLQKAEITITYAVDGVGGKIAGRSVQTIAKDGVTEMVSAVPDPGYQFVEWKEDKSTEPARQDSGKAAATFTAKFEAAKYVATYTIGEGGEKVSGELVQENIAFKGDAQPVEVKAKAGYVFLGWSDGVTTAKRTDKGITGNIEVTAEFMKPYAVPYTEDFENPEDHDRYWVATGLDKEGMAQWRLRKFALEGLQGGTYFWGLDQATYALDYDTKLYTPWISVDGLTGDLKFTYDYYYQKLFPDEPLTYIKCGYEFEDNNEVEFGVLPPCEVASAGHYDTKIDQATYGAHKRVRFFWSIKLKQPENLVMLYLDNVSVLNDNIKEVPHYYGVKGSGSLVLTSKPDVKEKNLVVMSAKGTEGAEVEAIADDGFEFRNWSDGLEASKRKDKDYIKVHAVFGKKEVAPVTLAYEATAGGHIDGIVNQVIEQGTIGSEVVAVGQLGYKFIGWDDGVMDVARIDTAKADKKFIAQFEPTTYQVAITVVLPNDEPIAGAKVTFRGVDSVTGEDGVAIFKGVTFTRPGESDSVVVTAENCDAVTLKNLYVDDDIESSVVLTPTFPKVKVKFVDLLGKALAEVNCKIGDADYTTNADGVVELNNVKFGEYPISASAEYYQELSITATIASDSLTCTMLPALLPVTVVVVNSVDNAPIENAYVQLLDGSFIPTDKQGIVSANYYYGKNTYRVTCEGYDPVDQIVDVTSDNFVDTVRLAGKLNVEFYATVDGQPVANVQVVVDSKDVSNATDETGSVKMPLTKGKHAYRALLTGHDPITGEVDVNADGQKVNLEFAPAVQQKLTFEVYVGKKAVAGAVIVLNGSEKLEPTNEAGKVTKALATGTYKYTVKAEGYSDYEGELVLRREDLTEIVTLAQKMQRVDFVVMIGTIAPMQNATIAIEGKALPLTNADGKTSVMLPKGTFEYNVYAKGYETMSGTVTVADEGVTENVVFEPSTPNVAVGDPKVTFAVTRDKKVPLQGATVVIDESIVLPVTNAKGVSVKAIPVGSHKYRVLVEGFDAQAGSFEAKEGDTVKVNFTSAPVYTVTFTLTEAGEPVAGEVVVLQNTRYKAKSDEKGIALIKGVAIGNYAYVIKHKGVEYTGGFVVKDNNVEVSVKMDKTDPVVSTLLAGVKLYPSPFNTAFRLEGVSSMVTLRVVTVSGRLVKQIQHNGAEYLDVDGTFFAPGLYILQLVDRDGAVKTLKAIKQ